MRCNLCKGSNITLKYHHPNGWNFDVYKCMDCGLMFQFPLPDDNAIKDMYNKGYFSGNSKYSYIDERKNISANSIVWENRLKNIKRYIKDKAHPTILDIGCAFGGFLSCAYKHGFVCYGVELSSYAVEYINENLPFIKVFNGEFENSNFNTSFDVITAIELIEHVRDPMKFFTKAYNMLNQNGLLIIQTANMSGIQAKLYGKKYHYFLPGHLFYFSHKTIKAYLKKAGFSKIKIISPSDISLKSKLRKTTLLGKGSLATLTRIISYHLISYLHFGGFYPTSSMVVYATK